MYTCKNLKGWSPNFSCLISHAKTFDHRWIVDFIINQIDNLVDAKFSTYFKSSDIYSEYKIRH